MNYSEATAWLQGNLATIILIILILILQFPSFAEKLGWYSKKKKEIQEQLKKERKTEFKGWATDFIQNYLPTLTKEYKEKIGLVEKHYSEIDAKLNKLIQSNVDLMRNEMKKIYYKYRKYKMIPEYDKQTFIKFYNHYSDFGGNTFIHSLYAEVTGWETVNSIDDIPGFID